MTKDCRGCGKLLILALGTNLPDYCFDCGSGRLLAYRQKNANGEPVNTAPAASTKPDPTGVDHPRKVRGYPR